ncbi:PPC domain-containing protein [Streptomyces sp. NPDC059002]|uniref:PPC domain-containing protein n=1 Tax=Streptomyces sp. NPDC059002 TaxID=3346690 RepID=UPI0036BCE063
MAGHPLQRRHDRMHGVRHPGPGQELPAQQCLRDDRQHRPLLHLDPSGTTSLTIKTSGGTGNADLYFNPDTWATPSVNTARSTGPDNTESLTVTGLRPGTYHYISLHAATSFTGATVSTSY